MGCMALAALVASACSRHAATNAPARAPVADAHVALTPPQMGLDLVARNHDASGSQRAGLCILEPWVAAAADFERALAQPGAPAHWRAAQQFALGRAAMLRSDTPAALGFFRAAVAAEPDWAPAHVGLADALRHGNDTPGAIVELREAERLEAGWWFPVARRAAMLASLGRHNESIAAYHGALALAPNEAAILDGLALVLSASGNGAEATVIAQSALRHDASSPWAHLVLAEQALGRGDGTTALAEATEAARVLPHATSPEHARADALALLRRRDEALAAYRHALEIGDETHSLGFPAERIAVVREAITHNRLPRSRFEAGRGRGQTPRVASVGRDGGVGVSWGGLLTGPGVDFERAGD